MRNNQARVERIPAFHAGSIKLAMGQLEEFAYHCGISAEFMI
jgi:hypothetical protein